MVQGQAIDGPRCELGEGVLWDDALRVVWWIDILAAQLWQHDPASGRCRSWELEQRPGCFALTHEPGTLLLGLERGLARFDSARASSRWLVDVEPDEPRTRLNDGRCDRHGNFIFGTKNDAGPEAIGGLYRYTPDGTLTQLALPRVAIANSICFSPAGETMYFCDSPTRRIMACAYDAATGQVGEPRVFADLAHTASEPDGSAVDADGGLWNAQWGGGCVTRYTADGRVDRRIGIAAQQATCVAFGGAALDLLYVTSAHTGLSAAQRTAAPDAGALFVGLPTGVRGLPESRFGRAAPAVSTGAAA